VVEKHFTEKAKLYMTTIILVCIMALALPATASATSYFNGWL